MTKWPKDNQTERNAFYGDPAKGEIADQLTPVVPPFAMYYDGKRVNNILFHRKAAPALLAALSEIWNYYGRDQKRVDAAGVSKYAGAYNHRMVRGSTTKWSNHAYGAAIDLNAEENGLYAKGNMPQPVIDAFCRQGWMWGGWYNGRKDPMHFEAVDNGGRVPAGAPIAVPVAKPAAGPAKPVASPAAKAATAGGAVVVAGAGAAAAQAGLSAPEILAIIAGVSLAIGAAIVIGYKILKGTWPWTSTGNQSQELSLLSPQNSGPSSAQVSAALLAVSSAASPVTPLPKSSGPTQRRKRSAKPSQKTRTPRKKSSSSKRTVARKSAPKRKSKSKG